MEPTGGPQSKRCGPLFFLGMAATGAKLNVWKFILVAGLTAFTFGLERVPGR